GVCSFLLYFFLWNNLFKYLNVYKLIARSNKRLWRLAFADADDELARLPKPRRQPRKVAIAGHDTEAVNTVGMQDVHCINDHRRVCRIFALGVAVLLHRRDGVRQQAALPVLHIRPRPVAVNALDRGDAVSVNFVYNFFDLLRRYIVRIDKNRYFKVFLLCHSFVSYTIFLSFSANYTILIRCANFC